MLCVEAKSACYAIACMPLFKKGDIGILRGDGTQTTQRIYWSGKATGITSDVPRKAELTPQLWGSLVFQTSQN